MHDKTRIVVKVGTNLLTDKLTGLNPDRINSIAGGVSHIQSLGYQVAVVSSGAIGAGVAARRLKERPKSMREKQATAAIGQPILMEAYESAFRSHSRMVGQILLTKDDFVNRERYLNARNTLSVLFENNVVPIINENDTVAVEEIKLGDNDNLSALVANMIGADLLIILSDVDGFYSDDPSRNRDAELIPVVDGDKDPGGETMHVSGDCDDHRKRRQSPGAAGDRFGRIQGDPVPSGCTPPEREEEMDRVCVTSARLRQD